MRFRVQNRDRARPGRPPKVGLSCLRYVGGVMSPIAHRLFRSGVVQVVPESSTMIVEIRVKYPV